MTTLHAPILPADRKLKNAFHQSRFYHLGKAPARIDKRTLKLADYLVTGELPKVQNRTDYGSRVPSFKMFANDRLGDCTCAAVANMIAAFVWYATGLVFDLTDAQVIEAYSAVSGYDPVTGANDNGAVILDVLNYWRQTGFAGHKILAYATVNRHLRTEMAQALDLFGSIDTGVMLPKSAQAQIGGLWDVPVGGAVGDGAVASWGGHCVPTQIINIDDVGVEFVTWAALQKASWPFVSTYVDEMFVVIAPEWIKANGLAPCGLNLAQLVADLKLVTA